MGKHIIDPQYFFDAVEQFAINYDWYTPINVPTLDDLGRRTMNFDKQVIRGSLQYDDSDLNLSKDGNTENMRATFYCMSLYRIDIGDYIFDDNKWLKVIGARNLDVAGVRIAKLIMVNLNNYRDFKDYLKYQTGEKLV